MADHSAIEWTEATWNPTTGCDRTSPGCDNCYALTLARRLKAMGNPKYQVDGDSVTTLVPALVSQTHRDQLSSYPVGGLPPDDLRELDERFVPSRGPRLVHS